MPIYVMKYIAQTVSWLIDAAFPLLFAANSIMSIQMANDNCFQC